jgi:hypothetical protein
MVAETIKLALVKSAKAACSLYIADADLRYASNKGRYSDVLGANGRILLSYLVHMHSSLRSLRQGQVHVGPITWEVLPQL